MTIARSNYLKTIIRGIFILGLLAVVIPWLLMRAGIGRLSWDLGSLRYVGVLFMIVGAGVSGWCAFEFAHRGEGTPAPFDPPKKLVAVGLYRFLRNPMYVGMWLLLFGEAIYCQRPVLFGYVLTLAGVIQLMVVFHEEPELRKRFGSDYDEYCKRVPRWFPPFRR